MPRRSHWSHDPTYQRNRSILLRLSRAAQAPCARCGQAIDYDAKRGPRAFICGHILGRHDGGGHELENLQPECSRCSARSGNVVTQRSKRAKRRVGERSTTASRW